MMLQKKTNLGTLMARYKQDEEYPGFWIDLKQSDKKEMRYICNIEYNPIKDCIQLVMYGNPNSDEPTDIIEVDLNKKEETT